MAHIQHQLPDKARRHYRNERAKDPTLPALVNGGGQVRANGKLCIELPLTDGSTVVYSARPVIEWRFALEPGGLKHRVNGDGAAAPTEASPSDRARQALDVLLNVLADAERHAEPKPNTAVNAH